MGIMEKTTADCAVDPRALRDVLGCFTTGVVVVTSRAADGKPVGLTVNSFNSVSLDPPLILWSIALKAPSIDAFRWHQGFAINILSAEQAGICKQFATPSDDKFAGVAWTDGLDGAPLIDGALAQLECRTQARYPGGDHEIYLGQVMRMHATDGDPLVYFRGRLAGLAAAE